MRLIRNFFHNISDIFLAIVIVAVAAGIIYWRLGIILDYPKQLADQQAVYLQEEEETSTEAAEEGQDGEAESGDAGAEDEAPETSEEKTAG